MGSQASPSTVRNPEGSIHLYTKGADTVLFDRLYKKGLKEWTTEEALTVRPCGKEGREGEGGGEGGRGGGHAKRRPQVCRVVMPLSARLSSPRPSTRGHGGLNSKLHLHRGAFFKLSHTRTLCGLALALDAAPCQARPGSGTHSLPGPNLLSPWGSQNSSAKLSRLCLFVSCQLL